MSRTIKTKEGNDVVYNKGVYWRDQNILDAAIIHDMGTDPF